MGNNIHPTAIIGDSVNLGNNNEILPYTVITDGVSIGDDNIIGPHVVIGTPGENTNNPRYDASNGLVEIGSRNIIKEFSTIHKPCIGDKTIVKNDIFMMKGSNIPHDAFIDDNVVLTPLVVLGGHVIILKGANIGLGAVLHQFTVIGQYAMVAANATMVKNLKPFSKYIPGKKLQVNDYNVKKYGFENYEDEISKYVLEKTFPKSDEILSIIEKYEKLHTDSNRNSY
jgi:UDP-N-acetylglucosamine acyltransferase